MLKLQVVTILFFTGIISLAQDNASRLPDLKILTEHNADSLTENLLARLPDIKSKVNWKMTAFGVKASFEMGYEQHISLYDERGNYVETLKKVVWGKSVSPTLRMGFEASIYGLLPPLTFWKNISLDNEDYFFELLGTDGLTKEVWADSNGNFFDTPLFVR